MKIGRNDSCPCGSGKKYKRCCLGAVDERAAAALADDLMAYAEPLFAVLPEDANEEATRAAVGIATICWKLALESDDGAREAAIQVVLDHAARTDDDRREREEVLRAMIARHHDMFPELHG